jgi:hypothetical protein
MRAKFKNTARLGIWRTAFTVALFVQLSLLVLPVFACETPTESFCVDFYKGRNLEGTAVVTRKAPYIKYSWGKRSPARKIPYDNFSARWRGHFQFTDEHYDFRVTADDGVRLILNGQPIIDHWDDAQGLVYSTQITPGAGIHLLEVEYFEGTGNAHVEVNWEPVSKGLTPNDNKAPLGINLSYFSYSSASVPFKDLITQSGLKGVFKKGSNKPCSQQPPLDAAGYPKHLPFDCVFRLASVFHILNDKFWPADTLPYQSGRYVLLYKGKGKIRLGWDAKNAMQKHNGRIEFDVPTPRSGIQLEVTKTDTTDPIRDLNIVHINDEATFRTQPFNDKWLNLLRPFTLVRFMDWGRVSETIKLYSGPALSHTSKTITLTSDAPAQTGAFDKMVAVVNIDGKWPRVMIDRYDGEMRTLHLKTPIEISKSGNQPTIYIHDFLNRTWADRVPVTDFEQGTLKGVSFETMIQLANTLNVNPWINIPTAANDDFVEKLATLIKTKLKPDLKCYIEYSNETWNTRFPGYNYAEAKSKELALKGTSPQADAWQAYRAVEIFRIFNRVFDEPDLHEDRTQSRLVRILTSQTAWLARGLRVMDWKMPNNAWPTQGQAAHKYADAWAGTTYFYVNGNEILEQSTMDKLFTLQIDNIDTMFGTADKPGIIRQTLAEVNTRGLQLVVYEGGTHLLASPVKPDLVARLAGVNKDQRMTEVYNRILKQWDLLYQEFGAEKIGVWTHYSDVSRYSQHGYWGLLQSTYQDPLTAPKYRAIKEYASDSP